MKLLFVISSLSSGGAERVVSLLANHFVQRYEVVIVTLSSTSSFYSLDEKIKHIKLDLLKDSKHIFETIENSLWRIRRLVEVFKKENPNLIISFMTHTNILSTIASKIAGKRVIISERIAYDYYGSKVVNMVRRLIYPWSDALITQTYTDFENYDFMKHVQVIYNPLDIKPYDKTIEREKIVLGVGRLDQQKGFDKLIKAFHQVGRDDWRLVIAGEGVERERLERLIQHLGVKNIELIGRTQEIFRWYQQASIFVLSSKREGFPNVLIEAMAFGCAVVSFDCPYGPNEIIQDGVNGLLVEDQNIKALTEALQRLMDDQRLRERLSREAFKVREIYHIEKIAGVWEEVIQQSLGKVNSE